MAKNKLHEQAKRVIVLANEIHKMATHSDKDLFNWGKEVYELIDKQNDSSFSLSLVSQITLRVRELNDLLECIVVESVMNKLVDVDFSNKLEEYNVELRKLQQLFEKQNKARSEILEDISNFETLVADVETNSIKEQIDKMIANEKLIDKVNEFLGDTPTFGSLIDKEEELNLDLSWRDEYPFLVVQNVMRNRMAKAQSEREQRIAESTENYNK